MQDEWSCKDVIQQRRLGRRFRKKKEQHSILLFQTYSTPRARCNGASVRQPLGSYWPTQNSRHDDWWNLEPSGCGVFSTTVCARRKLQPKKGEVSLARKVMKLSKIFKNPYTSALLTNNYLHQVLFSAFRISYYAGLVNNFLLHSPVIQMN